MCKYHEILITGGTSGLGLELVKVFLGKGYHVTATGREILKLPGAEGNLTFCKADFNHLSQTARAIEKLCSLHEFDIIINNAGILSPPVYTKSKDNLETTFQVNFLAHLLINEIIIRTRPVNRELRIFNISSPVYRIAARNLDLISEKEGYNPLVAYSLSKLFLLLMCRHLSTTYHGQGVSCYGLNPGVFRSGIKRTQRQAFRFLYGVASSFMKDPAGIAKLFSEVIEDKDLNDCMIYGVKQKPEKIPEIRGDVLTQFWKRNYDLISPFGDSLKNLKFVE